MKNRWLFPVLGVLVAIAIFPAAAQETSRYQEPYPEAASKKGVQVEIVDDALALGIKHATFNVNLCQLVAPHVGEPAKDQPRWRYADKDYYFDSGYVARLDRDIQAVSSQGVLVNLIILAYQSNDEQINRLMLHPGYDKNAPNRLGAFNTVTTEGQQWLAATMEFMAERWSRPDRKFGRVVGYIIGNEVNSHWWWSNMGRVTMPEFADDYHKAVRLTHDAVRRQSSWARVYISLEHHWNMRFQAGDELQSFSGKAFLDHFARLTREDERGDFDWNVAFHPYPENLFEPRFWNDKTALPTADTPRITFKNLEVLTDYLRRPELLYKQAPRRVILSEQGFHSPDGPEGEAIQAAAYCYAYKIVEANDAIDSFILHRHVDHPHEGGLRLGLRSYHPNAENPRPKKMIYDCFRAADTDQWEAAFKFALPLVGLEQWP
ncbi:MAG: hypothetical protein GXP26_09825 [Planctomycetes bacterium]|nr:hypothetical protein [Planctomycetota bacterium]